MSSLAAWLSDNWVSFFQTLGICGSLLFTAETLRRDVEAKRVSEYLTLNTQHRRLWGQLHQRPRLAHLLDADRSLETRPVTTEERLVLELAFVHFHTGWLVARKGSLVPLGVLAADAGHFFRLPVPREVWAQVRGTHQPEFVAFVEEAVRRIEAQRRSDAVQASRSGPTAKA